MVLAAIQSSAAAVPAGYLVFGEGRLVEQADGLAHSRCSSPTGPNQFCRPSNRFARLDARGREPVRPLPAEF